MRNVFSTRYFAAIGCVILSLVPGGPVTADSGVRQFAVPGTPGATGGHIAILGQVLRGGVYEVPSTPFTLNDVVQMAGGVSGQANGSVRIIRQGRGGYQTFLSANNNYKLWTGDVVVVEQRFQPQRGAGLRQATTIQFGQSTPAASPAINPVVAIACVHLTDKPVVLDIPAELASVRGVLQLLRYPVPMSASLAVIQPGRGQQTVSLNNMQDPLKLVSGAVLVFEPGTVITQRLPALPPVIRLTDARSSAADPHEGGIPGTSPASLLPASRPQPLVKEFTVPTGSRSVLPPLPGVAGFSPTSGLATSGSSEEQKTPQHAAAGVEGTAGLPDPQQPFSSQGVSPLKVGESVSLAESPAAGAAVPQRIHIEGATKIDDSTDEGTDPVIGLTQETAQGQSKSHFDLAMPLMTLVMGGLGVAGWFVARRKTAGELQAGSHGSAAFTSRQRERNQGGVRRSREARNRAELQPGNSPAISYDVILPPVVAMGGGAAGESIPSAAASLPVTDSPPVISLQPAQDEGGVQAGARPASLLGNRTAVSPGVLDRALATVHANRPGFSSPEEQASLRKAA